MKTLNLKKLFVMALFTATTVTQLTGCSVMMAANQDGRKDVSLLKAGTPRVLIQGEFGYPMSSGMIDGHKCDIIKFHQGYSDGARVARAATWAVADVATLGLTEVISTPVEAAANGNEVSYQVCYDSATDRAISVVQLSKASGK